MLNQHRKLCLHCDPYLSDRTHLFEKIEIIISPLLRLFDNLEEMVKKFPRLHFFINKINKILITGFLKTLLALKILKEVEAQDSDEDLYRRTLVVISEAQKRGIKIKSLKFFGKATNYFSIKINGTKRYFEGLPHLAIGNILPVDFDDKWKLKKLLKKNGLPHPQGNLFKNYFLALKYVNEIIGYPVVVKPRSGSLSKHTTCNIRTDSELKEAIRIAKMISREFIVEEFIEGKVYRILVINGKIVAACLREPPNIIGDGKHTIKELIEIKNQDPLRGKQHQKNFTLHKIEITEKAKSLLQAQNLNLNSVLTKGKKIYLHDKVVLNCGAEIHDKTEEIHPKNKLIFQKVYKLCKILLVGIDFIAEDISKPYFKQKSGIIEVNSLPYIDMHHYPTSGKRRNVAGELLDCYLAKFS